jgi:hypothetical protein
VAHHVTGLLCPLPAALEFAKSRSLREPVEMPFGLGLVPLRARELDGFLPAPLTGGHPDFVYLSDQLLAELTAISRMHPVLYFETEYFGGHGRQGAVLLRSGEIVYGPKSGGVGTINRALAMLGVARSGSDDEFQAVGLHLRRSTEEWLGVEDDDEE